MGIVAAVQVFSIVNCSPPPAVPQSNRREQCVRAQLSQRGRAPRLGGVGSPSGDSPPLGPRWPMGQEGMGAGIPLRGGLGTEQVSCLVAFPIFLSFSHENDGLT